MDLKLKGRVALVTGGSRGLGKALALGFAAEGAHVAICARNRERLENASQEVIAAGAECLAIPADLTDPAVCADVVAQTKARFGRIDILINNASAGADGATDTIDPALDQEVMVRFVGKTLAGVRCSRAAVPHMQEAKWGRVIFIGGTAARSASKRSDTDLPMSAAPMGMGNAAIANFARNLAEDVAGSGITVNVVHPHVLKTERHLARLESLMRQKNLTEEQANAVFLSKMPSNRYIEPSDVTGLVLLLCSPLASAINAQAIAVDDGALMQVAY
jgi:NAD(P)-dependent dehydrogenase (short-subunit alcohol dehydrogenase family)